MVEKKKPENEKKPKNEKRSWVVQARVVKIIEFVTSKCTEEDAREKFDALSVGESDIDIIDCEFLSIEPND